MKKLNYIEIYNADYYGESFGVNFDEECGYILENYRKSEEYKCYIGGWDEIIYYFIFEDDAKSFGKALRDAARLMREENYNPELDYKEVADLARLMEDANLGEEFYSNFKTNSLYYQSLVLLQHKHSIKGIDKLLTHGACYSSGNNVCFFGNKNMLDLIQKPEEFKKRILDYSFKNMLTEVLEYLGINTEEIKARKLKMKKEELKKEIKSLQNKLATAKRKLEALEAEN